MLANILRKEFRLALRAGRVWPLLVAWLLLSALAAAGAMTAQYRAQLERSVAAEADRAAWEAQGERNPHSAAHFGQYAYKPATALSALDPGLDAWFGTSVWMEAHYQNPASQRPAEDLTPLSRMGALSLSWMMQVLLPLTILVLGFDLLAEERARGALKLQVVAGATIPRLTFVKSVVLLGLGLLVTLPAWIAAIALGLGSASQDFPDGGARLSWWLAIYGVYGLIWIAFTIAVSARASTARLSLAILSGLWLLSVMLLPRWATEHAEARHPTPDPAAFWTAIRKAQSEGIDGHSPGDVRARRLEAETLERYGVDKLEDLPVSFAGVALQAGEEHSDLVFDRFFSQLWSVYLAQRDAQLLWAWLAPAIAARDLSTQAAGTDLAHHQRFAQAAEQHRRVLQRFLNDDMTRNAKAQDFDYRAPTDLWAKAPRLRYELPTVEPARPSLAILATWLILGLFACALSVSRLQRELVA